MGHVYPILPTSEGKAARKEIADVLLLSICGTLNSGDILNFEDGCLGDYTIVCSCFSIAADMFVGRLRVCRKAKMKCKKGVVLRQNEKDPLRYDYWWEEMEVYGHFI